LGKNLVSQERKHNFAQMEESMTRKRFVFFLCLLIFAQSFSIRGDEAKQEYEGGFTDANHVDLVILHINDTHGRLLPFDAQDQKSIGGIARLATLIKKIRNENAGRVLVLHAGDILSRGDTLTVYYGGEVDLAAMNAMDYDAFTPGNGEFYFGIENLRQQTALVRFPTLLANVVYRKDEKMVFQPYIIKDVAGIKVAILGLGFIRQEHPSAWPLILQDPIVVAKKYVPLLRKQADIVIALTHIGLEQDKKLAAEVPQIDIIVGGHSHNQLDTPLRIPKPDGTGEVIVVQAGDYGRFLGRLDIRLQKNENSQYYITKVEGQLLPIDSRIKEDIEINKLLKRYSEPLEEVLCTSEVTLTNPDSGDNPMGNLVVEALRSETNADVALLDRSAVQSGIGPGDITVADVFRIHPWRNRVLKLTLTGAQLQQILTKHDIFTVGCSFQKVEGEIKNLNIGKSPADSKKPYEVVAGEYLVGLVPDLREIPFDETGYRVDTILQNYLRRIDVIK
jgi:2',3'-cyclic-nucleotide 2'-phosphodiesterase (5'-nucleotidase family)